jgi:hypothetical protein
MTGNNVRGRKWKEAIMTYFKLRFRHFPGGTEEKLGKPVRFGDPTGIRTGHFVNTS